jgi:LemA protein
MPQSILVAIFTFVILLLMAGTFLFFYFRGLLHEVHEKWELVLDNLRLRLDKIPNLVETVRALAPGQEELVAELARLRAGSWQMVESGGSKVNRELEISEKLNDVWNLHGQFPGLEKDTNYLALKNEFKEVSKEIEKVLEDYNGQVRAYNKSVGNLLMRPFAMIFRISRLPVFEFEA